MENKEKKGIMKRLAEKIDGKLKEKSEENPPCCCDSSCSEKR